MDRKKVCFNILKGFTYGICFILFLVYGVSIMKQYFNELTGTSVDIDYNETLDMPAFTICPKIPFKNTAKESFPITDEEFYEITYQLEDIFHQDTIKVSYRNHICNIYLLIC